MHEVAAVERRRKHLASIAHDGLYPGSPYFYKNAWSDQFNDDAHTLADAYLAEREDMLSYDDMCYLSRLFNANQGGQDTHRWQRINEWFKGQIAALSPEKGPVTT